MNQGRPLVLSRTQPISSTDLMMLLMVLIWGVNYSVIKVALQTLPPFTFNFLRFTLATLLMVVLLRPRGETLWVARRDIPAMLLLGLTGQGVYQLFFISGLARSTATNTALILAAMPIFATIGAYITGVERASRLVWAGILLSFIGILVLILGSGEGISLGGRTMVGDLMVLAAAMLWAVVPDRQQAAAGSLFAGQSHHHADGHRHAATAPGGFTGHAKSELASRVAGSMGGRSLLRRAIDGG